MKNKVSNLKICTIKNVQAVLPELKKSAIANKISLLRDVLNKPKPQIVTMDEFLNYFGLSDISD